MAVLDGESAVVEVGRGWDVFHARDLAGPFLLLLGIPCRALSTAFATDGDVVGDEGVLIVTPGCRRGVAGLQVDEGGFVDEGTLAP